MVNLARVAETGWKIFSRERGEKRERCTLESDEIGSARKILTMIQLQ